MNKKLLLVTLFLLLGELVTFAKTSSSNTEDKLYKFGISGPGIAVSWYNTPISKFPVSEGFSNAGYAGLHLGIRGVYRLNSHFDLIGELNYLGTGGNYTKEDRRVTVIGEGKAMIHRAYGFNTLSVPLMISRKFVLDPDSKMPSYARPAIRISGGAVFNFNMSQKYSWSRYEGNIVVASKTYKEQIEFANPFNVGLAFEAAYDHILNTNFFVFLKYQQTLSQIFDGNHDTLDYHYSGASGDNWNTRMGTITLGVGIYIIKKRHKFDTSWM
ncbi:outer membrane beta-barrel protein [Persicobacter sp. CCB-QB2]|uniref:outer membrane beta-barrel protein n=1 Tax=Persicobacter sp. CCB-QB2 TaxID=1561025 RepID=UPI0006A9C593|nr:outer membrane beta-barrel protein [Persicobacter sp. CCB-QB2]